jgi:hypothetical protein
MTRLWAIGTEITTQDADTGPYGFTWTGRMYKTARVCNAWRAHTGWWQQEVWRDYFKLQTEDGLLCTVYHDLLLDRWYLARIYD